jgi:hypothetical protein
MKRITISLTVLACFFVGGVNAATYEFTGNPFTIKIGAYVSVPDARITGSITTTVAIPPNTIDLDIRTIIDSWEFSDGVQTITSQNGEYHPRFSTKFTTDGAGNLTRGDVWVGDDPLATAVNEKNDIIIISFTGGHASGLVQATCTLPNTDPPTPITNPCSTYAYGPDRGLLFGVPGTWKTVVPTYSVGGSVKGLSGSLTLLNNGGDSLTLNSNSVFTFSSELADTSNYLVTVSDKPANQRCTVSNSSGTITSSDITNVSVNCVTVEFTGLMASGAPGGLSLATVDPGCTLNPAPQFLAISGASKPPQPSIIPIDGIVQFTIDGCANGAPKIAGTTAVATTVTVRLDYGSALPVDATYWKVGDPWVELPATVQGNIIEFDIIDGGLGDDDGLVNGIIVNQGGASIVDLESVFRDGFED